MESYVMTVACSPRLSCLARIVSTLHARKAPVIGFRFAVARGGGVVVVDLEGGNRELLADQVRRLVDVTRVDVAGAPMAVAS